VRGRSRGKLNYRLQGKHSSGAQWFVGALNQQVTEGRGLKKKRRGVSDLERGIPDRSG